MRRNPRMRFLFSLLTYPPATQPPAWGNETLSRIYDAIKRAQSERDAAEKAKETPEFERRHAKRVAMLVPVYVYGHGTRQEPFHEETTSLVVNSHGALLKLSVNVKSGQQLLITNLATHVEQACRVVHFERKQKKHLEVAVAFTEPAPTFWSVPQDSAPPSEKQD